MHFIKPVLISKPMKAYLSISVMERAKSDDAGIISCLIAGSDVVNLSRRSTYNASERCHACHVGWLFGRSGFDARRQHQMTPRLRTG